MDKAGAQIKNQIYHLVISDIAMAMAIRTLDPESSVIHSVEDYTPGCVRESWLAKTTDKLLRMRVTPLATAGTASLQALSAEGLLSKAKEFGVPLDSAFAAEVADYFEARRARVLTYDR